MNTNEQSERDAFIEKLLPKVKHRPGMHGYECYSFADVTAAVRAALASQQPTAVNFDGAIPDAMRAFLRVCSSGGMSKKRIDVVMGCVDEAERLNYFKVAIAQRLLASSPAQPPAPPAQHVAKVVRSAHGSARVAVPDHVDFFKLPDGAKLYAEQPPASPAHGFGQKLMEQATGFTKPEAVPVARMHPDAYKRLLNGEPASCRQKTYGEPGEVLLYAAQPPAAQALTEEQIDAISARFSLMSFDKPEGRREFAHAIEAAHGIGTAKPAPREANNPRTALAMEFLVAAGHVSREKADEAYRLACEAVERERADQPAQPKGGDRG